MRIVLDLQGAQTESRYRGIGRYTLSLSQAIARQAGEHEICLVLNGLFKDTIEPIREVFDVLVPKENILVWQAPGPVREIEPANTWRRQAGERLREAFLASVRPDLVHISSLFEGFLDDAITSIGILTNTLTTTVTLYDLIPLIYRGSYLSNLAHEAYYERKLDHIRRAHLWLSISESTRREGIDYLGLPEEWVVNISTAADARFHPVDLPTDKVEALRHCYGIVRPFIMYTGGVDRRKNLERLLNAYAKIPMPLRSNYQLVLVGKMSESEMAKIRTYIHRNGFAKDEVVFTGYVNDEELVAFYNLCTVFVFPSWHEGFGLPALEAMACGGAVIGADNSSLPEVVGRADALFDPFDENAISSKLVQVLTDESFRTELKRHGLKQAKLFSWDRSARLALDAFVRLHQARQQENRLLVHCTKPCRPRLAFVSPLPPEKSGIADYSVELLPELARHYEIDVIVNQREITDLWVKANCHVRSTEWFSANSRRYDRVVYHFGNSPFHQHMFRLLEQHPGLVVLHDFFLSNVIAYMDESGFNTHAWTRALYWSHGYHAVRERFQATDTADVVLKYPCNFPVLQQAKGVIVHSDFSRRLADRWYGPEIAREWYVIPLLKAPVCTINRCVARKALGFGESDFVICSFGLLAPTKLNHRLLAVWLSTSLSKDKTSRLVFVGANHGGDYGAELLEIIHNSGYAERIQITGYVSAEQYRQYLMAADIAVQLRTFSRGETSAAVLDCMNYGLPTVVNAHGSLAELPEDCVVMLPDEFTDRHLAQALEELWRNPEQRQALGQRACAYIRFRHTPRMVADQYTRAIENFYNNLAVDRYFLMESLASLDGCPDEEGSWLHLAQSVSENLPLTQSKRQLLVDVSAIAKTDLKTGIERVVRSVLMELLKHPPVGFRVEPVYATKEFSYRYARRFTMESLSCPSNVLVDDPVELNSGDIFIGLDWEPEIVYQCEEFLAKACNIGVGIFFVIYDLLPIFRPDCFPAFSSELHRRWLGVVAQGDGALCISRAVADELTTWLESVQLHRQRPFKIGWFHLGANIDASLPTMGLPDGFNAHLSQLKNLPNVLMVGTVEPRKGHSQALASFERLWAHGVKVNLVVVGKQGWMVEELAARLQNHPELGKRLFWYQGISDEALLKLYETATGVLIASEGEGFGLPLIEAARHRRPILVRDIPVFQEVAGDYASYFSADTPEELAVALKEWLSALQSGTAPASEGMPWQTWAESTRQIVELLTEPDHPNWIHHWLPTSNSK